MALGVIVLLSNVLTYSPSGRSESSALAMLSYGKTKLVADAARRFFDSNGRLPKSLDELRDSEYGSPLALSGIEKKLRFVYLGDRGRPINTLMYCLPGDWTNEGVVFVDFNFEIHQESYRPWVNDFRQKVEGLATTMPQ
jgi:hypothetical protein